MKTLITLIALLFAVEVQAARWFNSPECPYTGHATCSDGVDNDADGTVDEAAPAAAFAADGVNYRANISDCQVVDGFTTTADTSFASGDYVDRPSTTPFWVGEIACAGNFTNATYDIFLYYSLPTGPRAIWIKAGTTHGLTLDNANAGLFLAQSSTPAWANNTTRLTKAGSLANFYTLTNSATALTLALNGDGVIFIKNEPGVRFGCIYLREASDTTDPTCPGETGSGEPAHYVAYKLSGAAPANCADAQFNAANIWNWVGTNTSSDATPTLKILHDATKFYVCGTFTDNDLRAATTANDNAGIVSDDRLEFSFRSDTATTARDLNTFKFVVNPQNAKYSANYPNATADTSQSFSEVCSVTLTGDLDSTADDTSWAVFCTITSPFALSDGLQIRATVFRADVDGTGTTSQAGYGSINTPSTWPIITVSGTTVPGGADVTAPTVTSPAVAAGTIEEASAIMTAATDEAGTCRVHYGLSTGSYTLQTAGSASVNGLCAESLGTGGAGSQTDPPLTAATQYFAVMKVTDAAGNVGTSTEVNFTTDAAAPPTCTYYAGPTTAGAADGSSNANRFLISSFWAVAGPGKSLCLADGTYTGTTSMIVPPANLSGTQLAPIKITGTNDGGAIIDGQSARRPIQLASNNDWWIIERLDAANSNDDIINISTGSDNNIIRRVVAYGGSVSANSACISLNSNTGNLIEDVAAFGPCRKVFAISSGNSNTTFRRTWGAWTRSQRTDPKMTYTVAYNSTGALCENCIGTWKEENTDSPTGSRHGIFANDQMQAGTSGVNKCSNAKYLGSIAYRRTVDTLRANYNGQLQSSTSVDCMTFEHVVAYDQDSAARITSLNNLSVTNDGPSQGNHIIRRSTLIGGAAASIGSDWTQSGNEDVATVGGASNIWNGAGTTGARVCKRYQNGTLTSTPLFLSDGKWPMGDRINAAITASGRNPDNYFGAGLELGGLLASIFGAIPAECKA